MPWEGEPPAVTWLPHGDLSRNVQAQRDEPGSVLNLSRDLVELRREFAGEPYSTGPTGPGVWAWRRGPTTIAVNLSGRPTHVRNVEGTVRISSDRSRDGERVSGRMRLEPWSGVVVR